ncbi:DNA repair protein rad18 [Lindgomyces ingoldianus]|uniref:DNA repair protein rad18 n=1 Tax=Lindgomyces ingoldianus TaxID=673940 RepID=A0ACB6R5A8_9PLEO|nr:DNA repair protein rad18 [Lindgomyces ingoldianus]KAF2473965.1 DNA repair protein rad18 [Lindgomyces ingoldianus]
MEPSLDFPDSTDWLATSLPSFEPLEAALRCEICKEFYDTPVITACSHTFCSRCIRRCVTVDGRCPTCKKGVHADKLVPNFVVREIVERYQSARPAAIELARREAEVAFPKEARKKRKLDDTDIEEEGNVRQTRSRQTRNRTGHGEGEGTPIEILDTDDEGDDEEFALEGMVRCPICRTPMKEERVFPHLNDCPGEQNARSRTNNTPSNSFLRPPQKQASPAPTRLPQLNYNLLKDQALRKKIGDLGIPNWGTKPLLIARHTEWLHLWNSNCDSVHPKSKRELLKELDIWERTQGGSAGAPEAKVMRKDFDGKGHAKQHENQFADLIAEARKKRTVVTTSEDLKDAAQTSDGTESGRLQSKEPQPTNEKTTLLESNETALVIVGEKVDQFDQGGSAVPSLSQETSSESNSSGVSRAGAIETVCEPPMGLANPFASPTRKLPVCSLPEDPIVDVDSSTAVQ